jgi:hypothetical protein
LFVSPACFLELLDYRSLPCLNLFCFACTSLNGLMQSTLTKDNVTTNNTHTDITEMATHNNNQDNDTDIETEQWTTPRKEKRHRESDELFEKARNSKKKPETNTTVIHLTSQTNIRHISLINFTKWLDNKFNIKPAQVKTTRTNALRIECTQAQASKLKLTTEFEGLTITCSENKPAINKNIKIIHGIPTADTVDDIKTALTDQQLQIDDVRRYYRLDPNTNTKVATQTVQITFSTTNNPESVTIGYRRFKLNDYEPRAIRCLNCMQYGHTSNRCNNRAKCSRCFASHKTEDCTAHTPKEFCKDCHATDHRAGHKTCPKYKESKQTMQLAQRQHSSYAMAAKAVRSGTAPQTSRSGKADITTLGSPRHPSGAARSHPPARGPRDLLHQPQHRDEPRSQLSTQPPRDTTVHQQVPPPATACQQQHDTERDTPALHQPTEDSITKEQVDKLAMALLSNKKFLHVLLQVLTVCRGNIDHEQQMDDITDIMSTVAALYPDVSYDMPTPERVIDAVKDTEWGDPANDHN